MSASSKKKLRKEQNIANLTEKQKKELQEAKKLKTYTLTFAVVMVLVIAIVIGVSVRTPVISAINRSTHAITVGDYKLTTADFSYYYFDSINKYCDEVYATYAETLGTYWAMMLGFNTNQPLDEQYYDSEKKVTWAQHFVDAAKDEAAKVYSIYDEAIKNNHKLTEEEQKQLDATEASLQAEAKYYNFSDANAYLRSNYGMGANVENYKNYYTVSTYAISYLTAYSDSLEYTDEDLREYEKDKYLNYTMFDYSYYLVRVDSYLKDGVKDEDGKVTYTDEQKKQAEAAAKADADSLMAGNITNSSKFDEAVKALAINKDNKTAGCTSKDNTFYENLDYKEFKDWLSEDGRKPNELGCIPLITTEEGKDGEEDKETLHGYLIIMFEDRDDCMDNLINVRHILSKFNYEYDAQGNQKLDPASEAKDKANAEKWLAEWKEGKATEESFAELANKYSEDGDGTSGGLIEDVYPTQMVAEFDAWCFDDARKPGDTGIVKTEYGYHVMYFVGECDQNFRDYMIEADMNYEDCEKWVEEHQNSIKVEEVNLSGLKWDYVMG